VARRVWTVQHPDISDARADFMLAVVTTSIPLDLDLRVPVDGRTCAMLVVMQSIK
jgi:hypothetical protein